MNTLAFLLRDLLLLGRQGECAFGDCFDAVGRRQVEEGVFLAGHC